MVRSEIILEWVEGPDVLDLGCAGHEVLPDSPYWLHGKIREKFPTAFGLDYSSENIQKMKQLGFENVFVGNAEEFSFDKQFDTIVAGELIEHLSNPGKFFESCAKHLKTNGNLVITTPYAFSLLYILYAFYKYPKTCQNDEHSMWFCPETLIEIGERFGYKVKHWNLIEDYEFDNPSILYKLFARFVTSVGKIILPRRLRNNVILCVFRLESSE